MLLLVQDGTERGMLVGLLALGLTVPLTALVLATEAAEPHFCPSENPADAPVGKAALAGEKGTGTFCSEDSAK